MTQQQSQSGTACAHTDTPKETPQPIATKGILLHTKQIDEAGVLTDLTMILTNFANALGFGSGEITITWNHDKCHISLRGACV